MAASKFLPQGSFSTLPVAAKVAMLFTGLVLLSAGYYLGVHMGVEQELQDAQRRNSGLQKELSQAHARQKEFLRLREELAGREALDQQNLRILPETAEIPAFLDDLNRLAELSGLSVGSVGPQPERAEQFFVRVPVALKLEGKYHQLAKFFYNVSRLERAINMENVALSAPKKEGEDILLSVSVMATTFRRPSESPAAKKGGK